MGCVIGAHIHRSSALPGHDNLIHVCVSSGLLRTDNLMQLVLRCTDTMTEALHHCLLSLFHKFVNASVCPKLRHDFPIYPSQGFSTWW